MIHLKNQQELEIMAKGGKILAEVLQEVLNNIRPGISEIELDQLAEKLIREKGGKPGFKKVKGYSYSICVATNDVVVHGIPTHYVFKDQDVVGIDCGVLYKGFHTDMAETVKVQSSKFPLRSEASKVQGNKDEKDKFLETGKKALEEAIKVATIRNRIGHISKTIQDIVEGAGYSVVRSLIGHGVGKSLHEEPEVPGFLAGVINRTPKLLEGMTIAIEVIYTMGKKDVMYANKDGWTIKTADSSLAGLFERTIAITKNGPRVLT